MKKLLPVVGIALLLFFLISQPGQSANLVREILSGLGAGAEAIITFVKDLTA